MDKTAIDILRKTMKTAQKESLKNWWEWNTYMQYITKEDFEYAKQHSVMFDRLYLNHDDMITSIRNAVAAIEIQDVVNAFVYSLSTRKLEYRSFLSSYCIARVLPEHSFTKGAFPNENICAVCGLQQHKTEEPVEFNAIHYFKFNDGCCFTGVIEVLFDMEQFSKFPKVKPVDEDYRILGELKKIIETAQPKDRIPQLKKSISKIIKSNDEERLGLADMLGVIGVLHDDKHFGYADNYVSYTEREERPVRFDDAAYPAGWWQGKFGVDEQKWNYWFGNR